ncbi:hypothetical protein ACHAXT_002531 [Thalassiosira profunda]
MARLLCIACLLVGASLVTATTTQQTPELRNDPRLPSKPGTKNWERLVGQQPTFSPRHSHATAVFKCPNTDNSTDASCLWLTGGYSESHRTWQGDVVENENADVWLSKDGATLTQVTELQGDFVQGVGNGDAKPGSYTAPWYSRYGHSLNALDVDGDGTADVLVLAGGFAPVPSNDVWLSTDGITWRFDGYAPWPKRAYHGATVKDGKLWIMGGSPLTNDVWSGSLVKDPAREVGYRLEWEQILQHNEAPWTPRARFCVVTLPTNSTEETSSLLLIGGLAHSEEGTPESDDGTRARNDVWKSSDGRNWRQVLPSTGEEMPWDARAFHACGTLTWPSLDEHSNQTLSRVYMTGGGYVGKRGNNVVTSLEAYTDTWYSADGAEWKRINYEEGSVHEDNLYSTSEWSETVIEERKIYRGKWGHSLEAFRVGSDNESESMTKGGVGPGLKDAYATATLPESIVKTDVAR